MKSKEGELKFDSPSFPHWPLSPSSAVGSDDPDPVLPGLVPAGTYVATMFQATPDGLRTINVLTAGGSLTVTVNADNSVNGTLYVPASVAGQDLTASMTGSWLPLAWACPFSSRRSIPSSAISSGRELLRSG